MEDNKKCEVRFGVIELEINFQGSMQRLWIRIDKSLSLREENLSYLEEERHDHFFVFLKFD